MITTKTKNASKNRAGAKRLAGEKKRTAMWNTVFSNEQQVAISV